ncbi:cache domain-containing sensor histidine kinase [Paenibacillus radicis (ex Xue et al. 2023)]|uniref:Sensor histidine kinase n=1 Tax=Paenibacillus radicis (ex Xue et al. 2023) TaxID=2972489 RepID=A0ABT1YIH3_9BACL|nr:sensor histidine kinase [Paenibacillus radicis (ex Xue et al. 2023)]MCR8632976.1 sensor histidine kinase [Paenibacillus radicis (ex Xue et al. 2023)]
MNTHNGITGLFRNMNMKNKLLIVFFLIGLLPILFFALIFYRDSTKAFEVELSKYTVEIAKQVGERLDSFVQEMERVGNIVRFDPDVQTILHDSQDPTEPALVYSIRSTRDLFDNIGNLRSHLKGIFLITDSGLLVYNGAGEVAKRNYSFEQDDWYWQIKQKELFHLNPVHPQTYLKDEPVVTFSARLMDNREFRTKGTLLFDFSPKIIREMSETIQLGSTGYVFMMTEDGRYVIPTEQSLSWLQEDNRLQFFQGKTSGHFQMKIDGQMMLVGFYTSSQTGWKIVGVVPFSELATEMQSIRVGIVLVGLAAIIVIFILSTALSRMITRPLKDLEQNMRVVEKGDFNVSLTLRSHDEIGRLSNQFNRMVAELNRMKDEVYMAEVREYRHQLLRKNSEMKALQAQINPHFLYNTLNVIVCIAEVYDVDDIVSVSQALSHMFKYSISGSSITTMEEEIDHLNAYLSIVQVRFPNKFTVRVHVDPELLPNKILKLICQPIVENSVTHAFQGREGIGEISIAVRNEGGDIVFRFEDNGIGIDEYRLREIHAQLQEDEPNFLDPNEHIGLVNVRLRLQMYYREKFSMNIWSRINEGTCVEMRIAGGIDTVQYVGRG